MSIVFMDTLIDDVGSFPLPQNVFRETYNQAYRLAREAITQRNFIDKDEFIRKYFHEVTINSFKKKITTGLDIINTPWHYDGIRQVSDVVHESMERGSFLVDKKDAFLPEVRAIETEAKKISEEFGKKILLRVSLYGPMEQYLKEIGTVCYKDVLNDLADTIRRFAENSIIDNKYIKTAVVSIDEPSFGFLDINEEKETIIKIMEKAFNFKGATRQIHLHSATRLLDLLNVKNIDVLSFEYAASPKNIESISKQNLIESNKQIRIGISRTDIDAITSELNDRGITNPTAEQLVDDEDTIRKRYNFAKKKFGETMTFSGPDCGLGGWPNQETAQLLLKRTVKALHNDRN